MKLFLWLLLIFIGCINRGFGEFCSLVHFHGGGIYEALTNDVLS